MTTIPLHLVLLAGGTGRRARRDDAQPPKQFTAAGGRPLLARPLAVLAAARGAASLVVVCDAAWWSLVTGTADALGIDLPLLPAAPGPTRTASTWHALRALAERVAPAPDHLVAVHDAARPFVTTDLLARVAAAAARHGAAVPGVPVADTVVAVAGGDAATAVTYLDRESLRAVQTPQVARWDLLHAAHAWAAGAGRSFTDDGGLLAARGHPPVLVPGDPDNWKVTTPADLDRARQRLAGETP